MTSEDKKIRDYFPILKNYDIAYIDNAATTQKPECVIEAVKHYYENDNANPLRGLYDLSIRATDDYENARKNVASFINAKDSSEIIFTRNASESLNLVAYSYAREFLREGDEIIISIMEHHSNMLPWQEAAKHTGATVKYIDCDENGYVSNEALKNAISSKTKIVAITQVSNVFGNENPIKELCATAHSFGAIFVCDGAQSVPHMPVDVQDLDVDFLAFSGHKMYSPMGIGVLYGKADLLNKMPPFLFGGEMIDYVTIEGATFSEIPHKFEAGTVNDGGAVGLSAAIDFIKSIGFETIQKRELALTEECLDEMKKIPYVHVIGGKTAKEHNGIITFKIEGVHPHDISAIFNASGVNVRAGHHCAQPLHKFLCIPSTTRASFAFYNTEDDVERFISCLKTIRRQMGYAE